MSATILTKRAWSSLALLMVWGISLSIKALSPNLPAPQLYRADNRQATIDHLGAEGIHLSLSRRLTPHAEIELLGFRGSSCHGMLYLLPLYRNAEATSLLPSQLLRAADNQGFIYRGRSFERFPSLQYWWFDYYDRLTHAPAHRPVFHFSEYGRCNLADRLMTL